MKTKNKHLIVITGPTAVGKTNLSIDLAQHFDTDIISCDSRQFYKELNIGTAKPTEDELKKVYHHFINSLSIHEDYSAGDFEREGIAKLESLFKTKDIVFLVGGSGLYIKALCEGLDEFPNVPKSIFNRYLTILENEGIEVLQNSLRLQDPETYNKLDPQNPQRIIRALSVIEVSGKKFSDFQSASKKYRPFTISYFILNRDREELYDRINRRVDLMFENGLLLEVKSLYPYAHLNSLQTVGYQELFPYFKEEIELKTAKELIKRNSRRYAKRQLTWFKKINGAHWFSCDDGAEIKSEIEKLTKQ